VHPRTGTDNDGFLNDSEMSGGVIAANGGVGYEKLYRVINDENRQNVTTGFNWNDLWGVPRQIRAGVMINFQ
jgi:hypothetical protein